VVEDLSDLELVERIRKRDEAALGTLYDRYGTLLFTVSLRIVGDRESAEEITQESFLKIWQRPDLFDDSRGGLRTWLVSITRNRSVDLLRSKQSPRRPETALENVEQQLSTPDTWEEVSRGLTAQRVRAAVGELPPDQRRVVELAFFGGYRHTEIAQIAGIPEGTVKSRLRLALDKIRKAMAGEEDLT
jgi:RNA polymerase sigma-70 factor (ECF subfamily)